MNALRAFESVSLRTKMAVLLVVLLMASLSVGIIWRLSFQVNKAETEMAEKARILAAQSDAVWEFMERNQRIIDTDSDGSYHFKGINCAVAGKQISEIFTAETDYVIRYTDFETRNPEDSPNSFEKRALESFASDPSLESYFYLDLKNRAFSYAAPLHIETSCLQCHGGPKGELDALGYPKEGLSSGDLAGIISIQIPTDLYASSMQDDITRQVLVMFLMALAISVIVYAVFTHLITRPLSELEHAADKISKGDMRVDLEINHAQGEIKKLAQRFAAMADELSKLYGGLEQQVRDRTEELARANEVLESQREKLEKANKILTEESKFKSDFLAIMSHELKTPLTSILAFTEFWEASHGGQCNGEDSMAIKEIRTNGLILLSMVNNILEAARFEAGGLSIVREPLDVVDLLPAVESTTLPMARKKGVDLRMSVDPETPILYADGEKVRRIVENLISNAIKFTPEKGNVSLEVMPCENGRAVVFRVSDDGIGIPPEKVPFIFDKFFQANSALDRSYGGSGLGLTVVKELCEAHGGSVTVHSEVDKGSVFEVVLPVDLGGWEEIG